MESAAINFPAIESVLSLGAGGARLDRSIPLYLEELADVVERALKDRWKGAWPINRRQVVAVGREFGVFVDIATENILDGLLVDNVIDVRDSGNERETLRRAVHELAELAARRTAVPEYVVKGGPPDALLAHRVAEVVDQRFDAFYRFVQLGKINELEQRKRRRHRAGKPDIETLEMTYEKDEYADPDFGEEKREASILSPGLTSSFRQKSGRRRRGGRTKQGGFERGG